MIQVNVHEAKTNLSRLLEKAHVGEEIIVAKAGKPYARLVRLKNQPSVYPKPTTTRSPPNSSIRFRKWNSQHGRTEFPA